MRLFFEITAAVLILLFSAGCRTAPQMTSDFHGLGNSPVSRAVAGSAFLGEKTIKWSVERLLNTPANLNNDASKPLLETLGFRCLDDHTCVYSGSVSAIFASADGSDRKNISKKIYVIVDPNKKPFVVEVRQEEID